MEKLGSFYLGKRVETAHKAHSEEAELQFDSKNLTTHAVCVGMTGSGKTGLGIATLEEAALNKIPAIIIDPKGDMGNLLLTFPQLSPSEFRPWIDEAEAERKGMSPAAYAETVAQTWKNGLSKWGEGAERIQKLRDAVEMVIYTPASKAGVPLSILSSFAVPSKELMLDAEAVRDRISSTTSSLLGLLGIEADPIKSREFILISTLIGRAWSSGSDLDIVTLIQQVQKPPIDKIGALDTDTFFPPKERLALSINLNNLIASPSFQAWLEGDPLDIQQLLYSKEGKPKLSILSIAHLSNSERMFFVTLLLNELLSWMRRQPGTSNLRALLYMDEIFGFFPPTAMPPSKIPMLTLLKQARAYGIGVFLATQNPVDLDYKGLSNCGTWFIGKLQTERDKSRVIEGLSSASNEIISTTSFEKMMAAIKNRIFILRSIYEKEPILFETRWTMSYLRGPLTLVQISRLMDKVKQAVSPSLTMKETRTPSEVKPIVPLSIDEFYLRKPGLKPPIHYQPRVLGLAKLHFIDAKSKIDTWQEVCLVSPVIDEGTSALWDQGISLTDVQNQLDKLPLSGSTFEELPAGLMNEKSYKNFEKSFSTFLYQNQTLTLYQAPELNLISKLNETESEFRSRIAQAVAEKREETIKKIQNQYAEKRAQLSEKVRRAQEKMNVKKHKAIWQKIEAFLSFLTTVLGAFIGRGLTKGTISQAGTSMRRAGRIGKESQDAAQAEQDYQNYQQQLEDLQLQLSNDIARASSTLDPNTMPLDKIILRPRKTDISLDKIGLLWWPREIT